MFKVGIVTEFSSESGRARVKFPEDDVVTDWLSVIVRRTLGDKTIDSLSVNEQVVCVFNDEDGVILGSIYSDEDQPSEEAGSKVWGREFADGTVIKYDQTSKKLEVKISSGGSVEIDGDLKVTGKIEATGDVSTSTASLNDHTHSAVQPGSGTSGPPVPGI